MWDEAIASSASCKSRAKQWLRATSGTSLPIAASLRDGGLERLDLRQREPTALAGVGLLRLGLAGSRLGLAGVRGRRGDDRLARRGLRRIDRLGRRRRS